jgi:hypothetical protein
LNETGSFSVSRGGPLRAKLAIARGSTRKQHARAFIAQHQAGAQNLQAEPAFATVAALPDWVLADEASRDMIARVAALLYHRDAVDAEIDGARLAALSQAVGEDIFDALCDCPPPAVMADVRQLPRPDSLSAIGNELMRASLPLALSDRFPGARGAGDIAELCDTAADIVAHHRSVI